MDKLDNTNDNLINKTSSEPAPKEELNFGSMSQFIDTLTNLTDKDRQVLQLLSKGKLKELEELESGLEPTQLMQLVNQVWGRASYDTDTGLYYRSDYYRIYDEMDETVAYISSALDILADDATQPDRDGEVIHVYSPSEKVQTLVQDMIDDLALEERVPKWARAIAKYGDFFLKLYYEENEGVLRIIDNIYPSLVSRRDFDGELVAFVDSDDGYFASDNISAPWDYVHFKHKGDLIKHRDRYSDQDLGGHDLSSSYGQSILKPAIKVYTQLRFTENMILLSRFTNSVKRNIFLINTGDQAPDKSFDTIRMYASLLKKNINLNIDDAIYNANKKTLTYDEDIFIPVANPKNDIEIKSVGGDVDIKEQYDLEYLLKKLFSSLRTPKAYLNYEQDLNSRATLTALDIRYARSVAGLQQTIRGGLLRLAYIHLAFNGVNPELAELDIQLTPVSSINENSLREELTTDLKLAQDMWRLLIDINEGLSSNGPSAALEPSHKALNLDYAAEYILRDLLKLDQSDINEILKKGQLDQETLDQLEPAEQIKLRINSGQGEAKQPEHKIRASANPDLRALYPTQEGKGEYIKLNEQLSKLKGVRVDETIIKEDR